MIKDYNSECVSASRPVFTFHSDSFENLNQSMAMDVVNGISKSIISISPDRPLVNNNIHIYKSALEHPRCEDWGDHIRILIDDSGQEEFQWIIQFAHEFMHVFIGGGLTGEKIGLWWFEEIVCSLSSLYQLWYRSTLCPSSVLASQLPCLLPASRWLSYLLELLNPLSDDFRVLPHQLDWAGILSSAGEYSSAQYDYFHAVAACMLPWFQSNPRLWRIVLPLKNARRHMSLSSILPKMMQEADCTYNEEMVGMFSYLLPRLENNVNFAI